MTPTQLGLLVSGLLAIALAYWLWQRVRAARARAGLPDGEVAYADTRRWARGKLLYSPQYGLSGKPDYMLRLGGETIPVEVKPGRAAGDPYASDVMQLVAYCLLVEECLGTRPSHGLLRYAERTFRIPYDDGLREELLGILDAMRHCAEAPDVPRSHASPARCRFCGQREHCTEAL